MMISHIVSIYTDPSVTIVASEVMWSVLECGMALENTITHGNSLDY